ncbi:MAG: cbb3-type cytochrome c oxidase subunit I, partial [Chloroflexi bacterium]|nr:cbb3-type cytochrome c oxidase subunit I [Chloroflexota bacterium]
HFHYTIMGGEIFAIIGALYYWFPKMSGRMYNERLGTLHFWWLFISYNVTFVAMFWVGMLGMPRRVADYPATMADANLFVSIAAFVLGASFLAFAGNFLYSWIKGPVASANPWKARTLEWETSSPPPLENFPSEPAVVGHPYDYGVPGAVHARFAPAGGSESGPHIEPKQGGK